MKKCLWDTHMHTSESSRCGRACAADMVIAYKEAGFHGIVVTDHFLNGNTAAPRGETWQGKADVLLAGFKAAKAAGDALNLRVLLGWEYYHQGGDFLTFGLTEAFVRDQPDLCDLPLETYAQRVRAAGGFLSQAHPFRQAWYLPEQVDVRWDLVDALEVVNGAHTGWRRRWDRKALALAKEKGLLRTAGSDAHDLAAAATVGVLFPDQVNTAEEFLSALRQDADMSAAPLFLSRGMRLR